MTKTLIPDYKLEQLIKDINEALGEHNVSVNRAERSETEVFRRADIGTRRLVCEGYATLSIETSPSTLHIEPNWLAIEKCLIAKLSAMGYKLHKYERSNYDFEVSVTFVFHGHTSRAFGSAEALPQ